MIIADVSNHMPKILRNVLLFRMMGVRLKNFIKKVVSMI